MTRTLVKKYIYANSGNTQYSAGQCIQFKFPDKDGFLIPESLKISYSVSVVDSGFIYGTPLYAPFSTLTTYINENVIEQLNRYNYLTGFILANGQYSLLDRVAMTQDYGYGSYVNTADSTPSIFKELDFGNTQPNVAGNNPLGYSGKLECILSHFSSPMPFKSLSPSIELILDDYPNYTAYINSFSINDVQLSYDVLYDDSMPIYKQLDSFTFFSNTSPLAPNPNGNFGISYNNPTIKYAIGAFHTFYSNGSLNFNAADITDFKGSYNLIFNNNQNYPDKTFFTHTNKRSLILSNFKETIRQIYKNKNLSGFINADNYVQFATTNDPFSPTKFIYAVPFGFEHDGIQLEQNTALLNISMPENIHTNSNFLSMLNICYKVIIDITPNGIIISK